MSPAKRRNAASEPAQPVGYDAVAAVEEQATTPADSEPTPTVDQPRPAAATDLDRYEPYPGANFFHGGRNSLIFRAMGHRLIAEDCNHYPGTPGADWTEAHRRSFAAWQHKLGSGDVSGIPDQEAWDQLHIPRVSPR